MGRGRPRKPSAVRHLEGNRSRTDIPPDLPLSGVPQCPRHLNGRAKEHFEFVAGELTSIGVTKHLDTEGLSALAMAWDRLCLAYDAGDDDTFCKVLAKWSALAGKYGLTPADRAKLTAAPAESKDPTELKFFAG